jgi:predicted nucleotide-binding protein
MSLSDKEVQLEILRNLYKQFRASPFYRFRFKVTAPKGVDLDTFEYNVRYLEEKELIETDASGAKITVKGIDFIEQNDEKTKTSSNDIFIVHGHDTKPVKELKAILEEFGLNPMVLYEKAGGSRTLIEKLEKWTRNVNYAFVILTPDDVGYSIEDFQKMIKDLFSDLGKMPAGTIWLDEKYMEKLKNYRARQNVVLEFGYFIGKLGRDRVCCLNSGNIKFPSDMKGIHYVPFQDSIVERREMILKELIEAGYKI